MQVRSSATGPTFRSTGHHYAIVCVRGLSPRRRRPTRSRSTATTRSPAPIAAEHHPPPGAGQPLELAFGSCRCVPHVEPTRLSKERRPAAARVDALRALALRLRPPPAEWPHALVLLGDQVYADEVSPQARALIRGRRDPAGRPAEEVADFEEYTYLYREAWGEPTMRWRCSTVPDADDLRRPRRPRRLEHSWTSVRRCARCLVARAHIEGAVHVVAGALPSTSATWRRRTSAPTRSTTRCATGRRRHDLRSARRAAERSTGRAGVTSASSGGPGCS